MTTNAKALVISIVIPVHNEAGNITALYSAIRKQEATLKSYRFEYIFVDDGSSDNSVAVVQQLATKHENVELLQLARNFGKEIATTAGLNHCHGDAAIMIDADLQHPPKIIPRFIEQWEAGYDVVIGRRDTSKEYTNFIKRLTSRAYYRLINAISSVEVVPGATDFRLLDRRVINEFNRFTERNRMTRGLVDWLGFARTFILFTPDKRLYGKRTYSYKSLIRLATNSIISLSRFPLQIAGYLGAFIVFISIPLNIFMVFNKVFGHNSLNFSGSAMLAAMVLFLIGIVLICLGLIALYIDNIHSEVLNRPLYVLRRSPEQRRRN